MRCQRWPIPVMVLISNMVTGYLLYLQLFGRPQYNSNFVEYNKGRIRGSDKSTILSNQNQALVEKSTSLSIQNLNVVNIKGEKHNVNLIPVHGNAWKNVIQECEAMTSEWAKHKSQESKVPLCSCAPKELSEYLFPSHANNIYSVLKIPLFNCISLT